MQHPCQLFGGLLANYPLSHTACCGHQRLVVVAHPQFDQAVRRDSRTTVQNACKSACCFDQGCLGRAKRQRWARSQIGLDAELRGDIAHEFKAHTLRDLDGWHVQGTA